MLDHIVQAVVLDHNLVAAVVLDHNLAVAEAAPIDRGDRIHPAVVDILQVVRHNLAAVVDSLEVGNLELDSLEVGNLELDSLEVGNLEGDLGCIGRAEDRNLAGESLKVCQHRERNVARYRTHDSEVDHLAGQDNRRTTCFLDKLVYKYVCTKKRRDYNCSENKIK